MIKNVAHKIAAVVCFLALLSSGCGGSGSGNLSGGSTPAVPAPAQQASSTSLHNLTFSVTEDKSTAAIGEPVTIHIALTNHTSGFIFANYAGFSNGSYTLDPLLFRTILVQDSSGHYINFDGSTITTMVSPTLRLATSFAPGQSYDTTLMYTFNRADTYTITATTRDLDLPDFSRAGPLTVTVH